MTAYRIHAFFMLFLDYSYGARFGGGVLVPPVRVPIINQFDQTLPISISAKHGDPFPLFILSSLRGSLSRFEASVPSQKVQKPSTRSTFSPHNRQNRPRFLSGKYIFYNYTTLGSSPYGEHWRNLRRITALDVLSTHRINNFSGIRRDETQRLVQKLVKDSVNDFAEVELTSKFYDMTFNNIMRMISGKRFYGDDCDMADVEEAKQVRAMVSELLKLSGANNKNDFMPILRLFDFEILEKRLFDFVHVAAYYWPRTGDTRTPPPKHAR